MDSTKQLFVRGCRSLNPDKRIRSIYKRFYYSAGSREDDTTCLAGILTGIIDKYCPMSCAELVNALSPDSKWKYELPENHSYHDHVLAVLTSKIRLSKTSCFNGLTTPAKFKDAA